MSMRLVLVSGCVGRADANRERIGSTEGVWSAVVAGLSAHVGSADVQRAGLAALQTLAHNNGTWRVTVPCQCA